MTNKRRIRLTVLGISGILMATSIIGFGIFQASKRAPQAQPVVTTAVEQEAKDIQPVLDTVKVDLPAVRHRTTRATTWEEAAKQARLSVGRSDPTQPFAMLPQQASVPVSKPAVPEHVVLPAPPAEYASLGNTGRQKTRESRLQPAPAPSIQYGSSRTVAAAPERVAEQIKVIGMLDGKAVIAFPRSLQLDKKYPRSITMGAGEKFDNFSVLSVNSDSVTLQEDGRNFVRNLEPVR